ncbi:hypothetical protein A6E01_19420 (plasmid) [Vibrio breoganii]|uniref:Uncharacterized protein n=2 Tax=Vibrio TaxID=662 RepID=A0AAN0XZF8_9VIBR|nr:hypothetical protein [Vibrio breoganii]ANO35386.1 hypothetical protein A6E01_19420 [Vibrio breoganii]PML12692.1 hypothetical protein BCT84_02085 [Vibrio breoganii]
MPHITLNLTNDDITTINRIKANSFTQFPTSLYNAIFDLQEKSHNAFFDTIQIDKQAGLLAPIKSTVELALNISNEDITQIEKVGQLYKVPFTEYLIASTSDVESKDERDITNTINKNVHDIRTTATQLHENLYATRIKHQCATNLIIWFKHLSEDHLELFIDIRNAIAKGEFDISGAGAGDADFSVKGLTDQFDIHINIKDICSFNVQFGLCNDGSGLHTFDEAIVNKSTPSEVWEAIESSIEPVEIAQATGFQSKGQLFDTPYGTQTTSKLISQLQLQLNQVKADYDQLKAS